MTKMINPAVMRAPTQQAQILGSAPAVSSVAAPVQSTAQQVVPRPATTTTLPAQTNTAVPQTGLIGSEQALLGGQSAALGALGASNTAATNYLNAAGGIQVAAPDPIAQAGYDSGIGSAQTNQAVAGLDPYAQSGTGAAKLQADISGANGPEAQAAAMASVQGSPYTEQMKQNAERAILQNAAVTGSVGGGNTLDQLYKNAASIFAQDQQTRFNNLGQVTNTGLTAAGQKGQLLGNQAQMLGNLESQKMSANAQLAATEYQGKLNTNLTNAQLKADAYSQLANLAQANGLNTAGLITGTAQQIAGGRTQAGQAIAQNANQAASNISNMLAQNGTAVSDMMAKDISTVTDLIYQSGMQEKIDSQQLAAIIANISGGQASTVAQGYSNIGSANAAGTLGMANALQSGVGQLIANSGTATAPRTNTTPQGGIIGAGTGAQYGAYA